MSALHVAVRGRVQGVGFRWFVREKARALGVHGWVRNRDGGDVEVAAFGSEPALVKFRDVLREGPPGAVVAGVDELPPVTAPPDGASFIILR